MPNPYALKQLMNLTTRFGLPDYPRNDSDIPLMSPPPAPAPTPWSVGPPQVSQGGDMAMPDPDQGVPSWPGTSMRMDAPPGSEQPTYDMPTPKMSMFAGGGNLSGNSALRDTDVQRYLGQQDLEGDLQDQIVNQIKARGYASASSNPATQREANAYSGNIDAFKQLLGNTQKDIAESPITQGIGEAEQYRQGTREANLSGFEGMPQQARAAREMEQSKINAPIEAAKVNQAGQLAQQEAQSQGLKDVANINADSLASQYAALQSALQGGNQAAISGITLPKSGGHISYQSPTQQAAGNTVPPAYMRDITTTRYNLQKAGASNGNFLTNMMGVNMGATPEKIAYDQAVAAALQSLPHVDQGIKDLATFIGENHDLDALGAEQLLQHPKVQAAFDLTDATPEELQQLNQLLYIVRGMPSPTDNAQPFWAGQ